MANKAISWHYPTARCIVPVMLWGFLWLIACGGSSDSVRDDTQTQGAANNTQAASVSVIGLVELSDNNDASGIHVYLPGTSLACYTDSDGNYTLPDVPAGRYDLMARLDGYQPILISQLTIPEVNEAAVLKQPKAMLLRQRQNARTMRAEGDALPAGALRGLVTLGRSSEPQSAGTNGTIILEDTPYRTVTDETGQFYFWQLPAGTYTLRAEAPRHRSYRSTVRVLPGEEPSTLTINLLPEPTANRRLIGRVDLTDIAGEPSVDFDLVTVQLLGYPEYTQTPTNDGSFAFNALEAGRYQVQAMAESFLPTAPMTVDLSDVPEVEIRLSLRQAEDLTGTASISGVVIRNDDGQLDSSGIQVALAGTSHLAITDAFGEFNMDRILPGEYTLLAQKAGYLTLEYGPLTLEAGQALELPPLALELDQEFPVVMKTDPEDDARDLLVRRELPVFVRFSKKMEPRSLRAAVSISPAVDFVVYAGRELPETDFDLMKIVLVGGNGERSAQLQTRYTVTIGTEAVDQEGLALEEPYRFSFTTGDPAVIGTYPDDGGRLNDLSPGSSLIVYFNAPMDHDSLTPKVIRMRPELPSEPLVYAEDDPETGWTQMRISGAWEPETEYRINIQRRARTAGRRALQNTPFEFTVNTSAQNLPPLGGPR